MRKELSRRDVIAGVAVVGTRMVVARGQAPAGSRDAHGGRPRNLVFERNPNREPATSIAYPPRHVHHFGQHGAGAEGLMAEGVRQWQEVLAGKAKPTLKMSRVFTESICGGHDDAQEVELYDGTLGVSKEFVAEHQRPVGQLQWNYDLATKYKNPGNVRGARWCSGVLIGDDLFLSAGHCFDEEEPLKGWKHPRDNKTNKKIPPREIATNMHVNFDYQFDAKGELREEYSVPVVELIEYRHGNLDYAILRLGEAVGGKYGTGRISKADANVQDMLCIIGHPAGVPKRVEAGPASDFMDTRIGYNTLDTLGGNSGSGILGPEGTLVGVHTNGGCDDPATGHNYGHRITSLIAVSPLLKKLAT